MAFLQKGSGRLRSAGACEAFSFGPLARDVETPPRAETCATCLLASAVIRAELTALFVAGEAVKSEFSTFEFKALKGPARTPIAAPGTPDVTPGIALHGRPVPTAPAVLQLGER